MSGFSKRLRVGLLLTLFNSSLVYAGPVDSVTMSGFSDGGIIAQLGTRFQNRVQSTEDNLFDDAKRRDALIMLRIQSKTDIPAAKSVVARAIHDRMDLMLEGQPEWIAQLKPDGQTVWTSNDLLFVSNRSEQHGLYIVRPKSGTSADKLAANIADARKTLMNARSISSPLAAQMNMRNLAMQGNDKSWSISLPALSTTSPNEVCIAIRNAFFEKIPANTMSQADINQAVGKICQYGTFADFSAAEADDVVPNSNYTRNPNALVNLSQQWLFLISNDRTQPSGSRAYLWTKTYGEGAGSGFTRKRSSEGVYSGGVLKGVIRPVIRSGWGPIDNSASAWDSGGGAVRLFPCDSNAQASLKVDDKTIVCPVKPQLLSLLPSDSFGNKVSVSNSEGWNIGGTLGIQGSGGPTPGGGTPTPTVVQPSLSITGGYTNTKTSTVTWDYEQTKSNGDTVYSRITEWIPNWRGLFDWAKATKMTSLSSATPLAATLNPQYSMVWQIPLAENTGRTLQFGSQYEVRWQSCPPFMLDYNNCNALNYNRNGVPSQVNGSNGLEDSRMRWFKGADFTLSL
ncbi:hypothetical protein [Burkholderia ubonensis]|uniref:hypothetical protein n=1 Tax=Burkholderia ubonensis TaxID=101571 RepID=UPI000A5EF281|nr:hypothetical protein [Burkholderia ubonensis]